MFDLVLNSFFAAIPVFVFFGIGFWLRYKKAIAPEHDNVILQLAMDVGYPCLIFYNITIGHAQFRRGSATIPAPPRCARSNSRQNGAQEAAARGQAYAGQRESHPYGLSQLPWLYRRAGDFWEVSPPAWFSLASSSFPES